MINCFIIINGVNMNMYISFHRSRRECNSRHWYRRGEEDNVFSSIRIPSHKQHKEGKRTLLYIILQK